MLSEASGNIYNTEIGTSALIFYFLHFRKYDHENKVHIQTNVTVNQTVWCTGVLHCRRREPERGTIYT